MLGVAVVAPGTLDSRAALPGHHPIYDKHLPKRQPSGRVRNQKIRPRVVGVAMSKDDVLFHTAEQCRQLALRVRTDAARQQLLRLADNFAAKAEQEREPARQLEAAD